MPVQRKDDHNEGFCIGLAGILDAMDSYGILPHGCGGRLRSWELEQRRTRCLRGRHCSDGFAQLREKNRLDLSLESLILKPEYGGLFCDEEANEALNRLLEAGYSFGR